VTDLPAPEVAGFERERVIGHAERGLVDVVADLGAERDPGARREIEVGIEVVEGALVRAGLKAPVEEHGPVDQVFHAAGAFGLEAVAEAEAEDVLRVNRVNVVVVREVEGQELEAGQLVIELREAGRFDRG